MLLTIAILSGIGFLFSFIDNLSENKCDVNLIMATILVLSTWQSCLPFAIIMIVVTLIIGFFGALNNQ